MSKITAIQLGSMTPAFPVAYNSYAKGLNLISCNRGKALTLAGGGHGLYLLPLFDKVTSIDNSRPQIAINEFYRAFIAKYDFVAWKKLFSEEPTAKKKESLFSDLSPLVSSQCRGIEFKEIINQIDFHNYSNPFFSTKETYNRVKDSIIRGNWEILLGEIPSALKIILKDAKFDFMNFLDLFVPGYTKLEGRKRILATAAKHLNKNGEILVEMAGLLMVPVVVRNELHVEDKCPSALITPGSLRLKAKLEMDVGDSPQAMKIYMFEKN